MDQNVIDHFEYIDGVAKAQLLVLRALLRKNPDLAQQINDYANKIESADENMGLSQIQLKAMVDTLKQLTG